MMKFLMRLIMAEEVITQQLNRYQEYKTSLLIQDII